MFLKTLTRNFIIVKYSFILTVKCLVKVVKQSFFKPFIDQYLYNMYTNTNYNNLTLASVHVMPHVFLSIDKYLSK